MALILLDLHLLWQINDSLMYWRILLMVMLQKLRNMELV